MSEYAEHRARRLWAAQGYEGWELPPYPVADELARSVCIGRVVMFPVGVSTSTMLMLIDSGFYPAPVHRDITAHFKAREKAQNRTLPK